MSAGGHLNEAQPALPASVQQPDAAPGTAGPALLNAGALAALGPADRAAAVARLQNTAGNAAVARMLAPERPTLARDGGASLAVAGLVLSGVSIVQSQVNASNGGLTYTSDQITYPKDYARAANLNHKEIPVAHFFSKGTFLDNDTTLKLYGDFTANAGEPAVMANVYIDLANTTTYYTSALSFKATALQTAYGTAQDPTVRFVCTGRFDPAGQGDTMYRVVLEVTHTGTVGIVSQEIVNGDGTISNWGAGFELRSGPMERMPGPGQPVEPDPPPPDLSGI